MAEGAKTQIKDELGPEYEDVDWRKLDPRQYDPRRIIREALMEDMDFSTEKKVLTETISMAAAVTVVQSLEPGELAPFDSEST